MTPSLSPSDCSVPGPATSVPPENPARAQDFVHGAYYPSWKIYRKKAPSCMNLDIISHVYYAFVRLRADAVQHLDEKADTQLPVDGTHGCLHALTQLRRDQHPHLKLLVSVGGGSGSQPFPLVAADPQKRHRFAHSLRAFIDRFSLDGADIDWEHPSTPAHGAAYASLLAAARAALPAPRYLLTTALPAGQWCLRHVPLAAVAPLLSHLHLMAYDYAGPWTARAGHCAQLHAPRAPPDAFAARSGDAAVRYLVERGVPPGKIVLGVPVYGRAFAGVARAGEEVRGPGGGEGGVYDYCELPLRGAREWVDEEVVAAGCVGGEEDGSWVSYETPWTVGRKAEYVREMGLAGLFYWTGVADKDGEGSLMESGWRALRGEV
ncbi:hypothetical protein SLS56_002459 [Neofusicoccum ribis]|uniref:chitinase n=1 Tax=Neofusicoccum ribis TaxID=45134 RepID=A0ABR3T4Y4_9PEZI